MRITLVLNIQNLLKYSTLNWVSRKMIYIYATRETFNDPILAAIKKYEKHPSIIKIAENIETNEVFKFSPVSCKDVVEVVKSLDISKATTSRNIPTKVFKQNFDVC